MEPKTCQNQREACHNRIGPNPFDLCNECLFFNALLDLRFYAKDLKNEYDDNGGEKPEQAPAPYFLGVRDWLLHRPTNLPANLRVKQEYYDLLKAVSDGQGVIKSLLALETLLLKQMPKTMRDNQEDCSTILNLI